MKYIYIVLFFLLSCDKTRPDAVSDITQPLVNEPAVTQPKTVVILGNSITMHGPKEDIGWSGNWGMAATARDSDFVHILAKEMQSLQSVVKFKNVADYERDAKNFNLSTLDSLQKPDVLIMRISENVTDTNNFYNNYDKLIKYIGAKKVIITNGFWNNTANQVIERYATSNNLPFIRMNDLDRNEYKAIGQFENKDVAAHPSNKGMKEIAARIWAELKTNL